MRADMAKKSIKKVYRNGNVAWATSTDFFKPHAPLDIRYPLTSEVLDRARDRRTSNVIDGIRKPNIIPKWMHRLTGTRFFGFLMTLLIVAFCLGLMTRQSYYCINKYDLFVS